MIKMIKIINTSPPHYFRTTRLLVCIVAGYAKKSGTCLRTQTHLKLLKYDP